MWQPSADIAECSILGPCLWDGCCWAGAMAGNGAGRAVTSIQRWGLLEPCAMGTRFMQVALAMHSPFTRVCCHCAPWCCCSARVRVWGQGQDRLCAGAGWGVLPPELWFAGCPPGMASSATAQLESPCVLVPERCECLCVVHCMLFRSFSSFLQSALYFKHSILTHKKLQLLFTLAT